MRRPRRSRLLEWLLQHVGHEGTDCLIWPFGRDSQKRGELSIAGKMKNSAREMCRLAHGDPPSPKHEAAHLCGKGHEACVNPTHLAWKTKAENEADKILHGTLNRGERNGSAILTVPDVLAIRVASAAGERQKDIAARFGVSTTAIRQIQKGRKWGWLDAS